MKKFLVACAIASVAILGCKKEGPPGEPTNASGARTPIGDALQQEVNQATGGESAPAQQ